MIKLGLIVTATVTALGLIWALGAILFITITGHYAEKAETYERHPSQQRNK